MKGLDSILLHNGFSMAAVGVTIVFTSLVALALAISQIHRLLFIYDNRKAYAKRGINLFTFRRESKAESAVIDFQTVHEPARQFHLLVQTMGEPFSLPKLISRAESLGIRHPHLKASNLILSSLITPDQQGFFQWNDKLYGNLKRRKH